MARSPLQFGFVIDPLENFHPLRETTLFVMLEAQKRGHSLWAFELGNLSWNKTTLQAHAFEIKILGIGKRPFYEKKREALIALETLDALFLRKDPPFDLSYLHHLYLLRTLQDRVLMVNEPLGILKASEKIYPLEFLEFTPSTLITRNFQDLSQFASPFPEGIVLKPLHRSGGAGVFRLKPSDSNLAVAFETLSEEGKYYVVAQEYLPAVEQGDKRVILLNGEILGFFARVPQQGNHRANLHSGGRLSPCELTPKERAIAEALAPALLKEGLYFVGLDLIGEKLTEINVTSPMGINEINQTRGIRSEEKVVDFVESRIR